jgi:hypothetical protein
MASERLLVMKDVDQAFWQRIKDALSNYEVDRAASSQNVWDVRDRGTSEDKIYLWGRDGWREGFWHALICLDGNEVWIERGTDMRAENLTRSRKRFAVVIEPLLLQGPVDVETTEHPSGLE